MCLPGTHTKWVQVDIADNASAKVIDFTTQMTGEIHNVLLQHSILGRLNTADQNSSIDMQAFKQGVERARAKGGLLHHLFSARTQVLSDSINGESVDSYLSGLLIGSEVQEMLAVFTNFKTVYLVGNGRLNEIYKYVLELENINAVCIDGKKASCNGMLAIAQETKIVQLEKNT